MWLLSRQSPRRLSRNAFVNLRTPKERGPSEQRAQSRNKACFADLVVCNPNHAYASTLKPPLSVAIIGSAQRTRVNSAIDLNRQTKLCTIQIDDKPLDDLLSAELQAQQSAVANQLPCSPFGCSGASTKSARELAFSRRDRCPHAHR